MAMQDFAQQAAAALNGAGTNNNQQDLPEAKIWMNIGKIVPSVDDEGNACEIFVSLPRGVPFDTMEAQEARGNNVSYNQRIEAGNMLMAQYQEKTSLLEPGEVYWVRGGDHGFDIEFRRKAESGTAGTHAAGNENPLLAAMGSHIKLVK